MDFKWYKETAAVTCDGNKITITATPGADYFNWATDSDESGYSLNMKNSAPFYCTEVEGDFVMSAKVSLEFRDTYDSACLMILNSLQSWAKVCFEQTDFGTHAVVSVVTDDLSDDSNGANVDVPAVWLKACRVGNDFSFHYSLDGENYSMMRFFHLQSAPSVKVGLLAQAPTGDGGDRVFENFAIEKRTVENIRAGK